MPTCQAIGAAVGQQMKAPRNAAGGQAVVQRASRGWAALVVRPRNRKQAWPQAGVHAGQQRTPHSGEPALAPASQCAPTTPAHLSDQRHGPSMTGQHQRSKPNGQDRRAWWRSHTSAAARQRRVPNNSGINYAADLASSSSATSPSLTIQWALTTWLSQQILPPPTSSPKSR
jgi:hypothetical protein